MGADLHIGPLLALGIFLHFIRLDSPEQHRTLVIPTQQNPRNAAGRLRPALPSF